ARRVCRALLHRLGDPRALHSFPTRRSSDLLGVILMLVTAAVAIVVADPVLAVVGFLIFPAIALLNLDYQRRLSPLAMRAQQLRADRKSTRLNSSHVKISYAVFCLKKKNQPPAAAAKRPQGVHRDRLHPDRGPAAGGRARAAGAAGMPQPVPVRAAPPRRRDRGRTG